MGKILYVDFSNKVLVGSFEDVDAYFEVIQNEALEVLLQSETPLKMAVKSESFK